MIPAEVFVVLLDDRLACLDVRVIITEVVNEQILGLLQLFHAAFQLSVEHHCATEIHQAETDCEMVVTEQLKSDVESSLQVFSRVIDLPHGQVGPSDVKVHICHAWVVLAIRLQPRPDYALL
jgi:hypothetical protein